MQPDMKFAALMGASVIVFALVVSSALARRTEKPNAVLVSALAIFICAGGMLFARSGAQWGLPWTIYYTLPAAATILLPPVLLAMNWRESAWYLLLSSLSAPAIHAAFSFFLGWNEYMPFIQVPYWKDVFQL